MKKLSAFFLPLLLCVFQNGWALQPIYGNDLPKDEKLRHYQFSQKMGADNFTRYEYIQREKDKKRVLYYTHQRVIYPWLSHDQRFVLISDNCSSELAMTLLFDFEKKKSYRIDENAIRDYLLRHQMTEAKYTLDSMNSSPVDLSPDDREVLIEILLTPPVHRIPKFLKKYPDWYYAVNSSSGAILKNYKSSPVPDKWWTEGQ